MGIPGIRHHVGQDSTAVDRLSLLDWLALLDRLALAPYSCQREPGLMDGTVGLAPHARTILAVLPRRAF
ncbi:hypothetical protein [Arthrobacter sp. 31Y]|uniref:hypothetical protein n=1 Tax=Arthrobacter sp. 31Y TaxID=1115632 RepID=UPI0016399AA5|nr:hypothetical protein [Arthrobacter sp. 31Y]